MRSPRERDRSGIHVAEYLTLAATRSPGGTVAAGGASSRMADQTRESIELENPPKILPRELKSSSDKLRGATTLVLATM